MPSQIFTGKQVTITIDGDVYDDQVNSAVLTTNNNSVTVQTLSGPVSAQLPATYELTISAYQDWGAASSFCEALWAAALTGTNVAFEIEVGTKSLTGNCVPMFPDMGGAADGVLEFSLTLPVSGVPTLA